MLKSTLILVQILLDVTSNSQIPTLPYLKIVWSSQDIILQEEQHFLALLRILQMKHIEGWEEKEKAPGKWVDFTNNELLSDDKELSHMS